MKKRITSIILAISIALNLIPYSATAAPIEPDNEIIPRSIPKGDSAGTGERKHLHENADVNADEIINNLPNLPNLPYLPVVQQAHFKDIQSDDEAAYYDGIFYVKNQILLNTYENVSYEV